MRSGARFTERAGAALASSSFLVFVEIRKFGAVPFQSVSMSVSVSVSSVQFSYALKPGGPEWGKWRLWAAQGVFRAVQTGAQDLELSAAS